MYKAARLSALLLLASVVTLQAQEAKRPLTLEDYGAWSRINQVQLAPNGQWMAYAHSPNDGDATFFVRSLDGDDVHEAMNGSGARFSNDGRWVAFLTSPPEEEADRLRESSEPVRRAMHLIDLTSGERTEESSVRSFSFSDDGGFLAIHREKSDSDAEHDGSDLILRDLGAGTMLSFGNVSAFAFNEAGDRLAYLVDADAMAGNGLYLVSPTDGRIRPLDTGSHKYDDLAWNDDGTALVALRGDESDELVQRQNALVVASGIGGTPSTTTFDPSGDPSFPAGFVLSELANTRWTEDGARVIVGIKEQEQEVEEEDGDGPNVDVWHWADDRLQSVQMVQANADRRFTYTSVYNVDDNRFVRVAQDGMERVAITADGRWGIGRQNSGYVDDLTVAGGLTDYVRIDLDNGEQRDMKQGVRRTMGTSPGGDWFVYMEDEQVLAMNLSSLESTNLSERAGIDFVNRDFDQVNEAPAHGIAGWTEDGSVLLYDRWDVWQVPLQGGDVVNLTGGMGAAESIRFRVVRLDAEADYVDPEETILSAYGEWTKQSGYFRARPGSRPEPLLFGDEMIGQVRKAADADRIVFTRQTFEQFPDYWSANTRFQNPTRVTDANPQIAEFTWGRRILVDYTDDRGNNLQATLALPAGYVEGQQYPMIVYFYEKMSQRHHQFSMPVYDDRPHMSTYASNGYLVLMPDIVYDDGYPGSSALDDVVSAVEETIESGYADPEAVGLQGHSWGGYETSFILTQTDMFKTIVTGAPLTNLMSMNNILYKRTGNQNGPILQWSQGRMGDQPWDDMERWISQSPVHHAPNIETPFLILHGTEDGAVDWNQGLEMYTAARRLGKEVILLSYPDEPHHLTKEANQKDFQERMKQYFDHYLMGLPAPEWITDGVPFLRKGREGSRRVIS
jgi:dipeptidyl aminopeptidase/acylaminoacyl peptidase